MFTDILLPVASEPKHSWRMVEIKSYDQRQGLS